MKCPNEAIAFLLIAAWDEARRLPRVVAFLNEIPVVTANDVAHQRALSAEQHAFLVQEADGQPVSLVEVRVTGDGQGEVGWFATHTDHRRRGHAAAGLQAALGFLRDRGVREVRTASFVDSRVVSACGLLEANGFEVRDPDQQNMTMQVDLAAYEERPVALPSGYSFVSLTRDLVLAWCEVKDGVFGGHTPPQWFADTFGDRWDFDTAGWYLLDHLGQKVGIAGADIFRDREQPTRVTGCQIEYVGVLPEHRGQRLGEALVLQCLNHAKRLDAIPCQLITQEFRVPAVTLYESLGFRRVRQNRPYSLTLEP